MDPFYVSWMGGLAQGLEGLEPAARAKVLSACGKACAAPEILPVYQEIFARSETPDAFFQTVNNKMEGISVRTVKPGREYDFCYPSCYCPLHTDCGCVSPILCECSRESLTWVMRSLFSDDLPQVELLESILRGDQVCRLRVRLY